MHQRSFQRPVQTTSVSGSRGNVAGRMFLWAGKKGEQVSDPEQRTIYQKIREYNTLDKRKTVTALKAGEDRAILLGLTMIVFSIMAYFVLGITMVRSYSESVWTEEASCKVINSTIVGKVNCTYSCGSDCRKSSRYPCLQVFVSVNTSGRTVRLFHNEETLVMNSECFYVPKCRKDYNSMHMVITNISERLSLHRQVRCYFDPAQRHANALLTQLYGQGAVFHSFFWPTVMFTGGAVIIAMVKLTQYLSILCEKISKIKRHRSCRSNHVQQELLY